MLGWVLKKVGVGVLKGKKCESQAPNFSFAFAKGRRVEVGGREGMHAQWRVTRKLVPSLPSYLPTGVQ